MPRALLGCAPRRQRARMPRALLGCAPRRTLRKTLPRALLGCAPRRTLRKTLNATKRTLERARSDAARVRGACPAGLSGRL